MGEKSGITYTDFSAEIVASHSRRKSMWALMIGLALNDPAATEIARYPTEQECRKAELIIWHYSQKAAEQRGVKEPADIYGICKKVP